MIKQLLLILCMYLGIYTNSYAQYAEWSPIGAVWYHNADNRMEYSSEYFVSECTKDTMYHNQLCRQIVQRKIVQDSSVHLYRILHTYQSNDTVYYYNEIWGQFLAMYIFNVQVGDTLTFTVPDTSNYNQCSPLQPTYQVVVDSVKQVIVQQDTLIHIYNRPLPPCEWVPWYGLYYAEKIGSSFTAIVPSDANVIMEFDEGIRCYQDANIAMNFINNAACDHWYRSHLANIKLDNTQQLTIYPNPAQEQLTISTTSDIGIEYLEIINVLGEVVYREHIIGSPKQYTINIGTLGNGVYVCKVENGTLLKPFVVAR